jgi:hypothetical protein
MNITHSELELFHLLQRSQALAATIRRYEDELKTVNRRIRDYAFQEAPTPSSFSKDCYAITSPEDVTAELKALNLRARITRRFTRHWDQDALWRLVNEDNYSGVISDRLSVNLDAAWELAPHERDEILNALRLMEREPRVDVLTEPPHEDEDGDVAVSLTEPLALLRAPTSDNRECEQKALSKLKEDLLRDANERKLKEMLRDDDDNDGDSHGL